MSKLSLSSASPIRASADAVVIGIQPAKRGLTLAAGAEAVARAYGSRLADDLTALGATGKAGDVVRVPARGRLGASLLVAVGLGDDPGLEALRSGAGAAARLSAGEQTVLLALPAETEEQVEAVAEGALLGAYAYTEYRRTNKTTKRPAQAFTLVTPLAETKGAKAQVARAKVLARSVHLVRDLVNTPPSDLHPDDFARTAAKAGSAAKLGVDVWDSQQLRDQGFGGLTAVGQGSAHGPRLVRIEYRPQTARHHIALVGKGITFDSGGLSLKPPTAMEWMKTDMSGAAAVLATLVAVARLKPDVAVTGWLALAENMPSGTAQRPGDVITIYGGKTVEVLNTDAEGRLVLADALVRAQEDHPDVLVDVATLTGAQIVALGTRVSAIMSNDEALRTRVHAVADRVGESMWPMPLPVELRPSLDSRIADLANIGDRFGGMLTAGLFLKEFVADDLAWAHLDIAGPSYNDKEPYGYTPKGATGVAVRTLVGLVEDVDAEGLVEKG